MENNAKNHRDRVQQSWEKFLDPGTLRSNLIACSLFIVAWETFCRTSIDNLHGFYNFGVDPELGESENYRSRVLDRHKSRLMASLLWFQEMGAIDQDDLNLVKRIKDHRNEIAHELPKYLCQAGHEIDVELFGKLTDLISKIGRWWVMEIEVPTNSDFDGVEIDPEEVQSGDMWFLGMLLQVATGDEEEASKLYQQFTEAASKLP
ncbi:hypothetical protein [Roseiconus lacunae]|uniref:RiboL-PSP-HEPN domain-containing protein n=1 Tax=Roseiconus lacunae TaxID=2605694 RepID=A0ABT7PEG4_9BACT|nr:hypothetical protein [Roseiconus lacunae]MDM4014890.1 hypothetical protein [Roseiconus lacunae]